MDAKVQAYLSFENSKEAIKYYQDVFGATDVYRMSPTDGQAKMFGLDKKSDLNNYTMYGGFKILGIEFSFSDSFGNPINQNGPVSVMLDVNSEDPKAISAIDDLYDQLANSKQVEINMPFESQFWGNRMGTVTDKYGIVWMLSCSPWTQK
ncbi:VOC family protein [Companilactobacillus mishanensis]|uniref:VOC family protein n=1 Tax=Companilactobacillus mishanensis TaxID=2486008 RepID=UPI0012976955|nr:glyoxalase/bleomycin resistance/extradiol dioxygenase family protein [Companilactobacillus mishanensis]MQS89584.1 glyoxalase/bleomycin resistance/extradiol dioxygenase family protein [Companilactobacillus mishanensis]